MSFADDSAYPDDAGSQKKDGANNEQQKQEEEYSTGGIWYYGDSDDKESPCDANDSADLQKTNAVLMQRLSEVERNASTTIEGLKARFRSLS